MLNMFLTAQRSIRLMAC